MGDFGRLVVGGAGVPVAERDVDGVTADCHSHGHVVLRGFVSKVVTGLEAFFLPRSDLVRLRAGMKSRTCRAGVPRRRR